MIITIFRLFCLFLFLLSSNSSAQNNIILDPLSVRSLYLEQFLNSQKLGRATGFIVERDSIPYLITNWHVVTGRHPITCDTLDTHKRIPNRIVIFHHHKDLLGKWISKDERLYDESGNRRWIEHPNGKNVDVVALPISAIDPDVKIYSFDLNLANTDMIPEVAMPVSIIGYPGGLKGIGNFPIWKTGHIASEPDLDYNGEPVFLIDATTRAGMSGSPVILRLKGGYRKRSGDRMMASTGYSTLFLGVYSAQWSVLEIGKVWKPIVIHEIF